MKKNNLDDADFDIYDNDNLINQFCKKSETPQFKSKEFYVTNKELCAEIKKYQQSGVISEELGTMVMKIATRFSMHPRFFNYSYREDFVADAIYRVLDAGLDKINLNHPKCNAFAYVTQCCYNTFRQKIKSEKRHVQVKNKMAEELYDDFENREGLDMTKNNDVDRDDLLVSSNDD